MSNFGDPNLVTFYFYELTHFLDWMHFTFHLQYKHSGAFTNRKYEELSWKCDSIIIVNPVMKMWPHPAAYPR